MVKMYVVVVRMYVCVCAPDHHPISQQIVSPDDLGGTLTIVPLTLFNLSCFCSTNLCEMEIVRTFNLRKVLNQIKLRRIGKQPLKVL